MKPWSVILFWLCCVTSQPAYSTLWCQVSGRDYLLPCMTQDKLGPFTLMKACLERQFSGEEPVVWFANDAHVRQGNWAMSLNCDIRPLTKEEIAAKIKKDGDTHAPALLNFSKNVALDPKGLGLLESRSSAANLSTGTGQSAPASGAETCKPGVAPERPRYGGIADRRSSKAPGAGRAPAQEQCEASAQAVPRVATRTFIMETRARTGEPITLQVSASNEQEAQQFASQLNEHSGTGVWTHRESRGGPCPFTRTWSAHAITRSRDTQGGPWSSVSSSQGFACGASSADAAVKTAYRACQEGGPCNSSNGFIEFYVYENDGTKGRAQKMPTLAICNYEVGRPGWANRDSARCAKISAPE